MLSAQPIGIYPGAAAHLLLPHLHNGSKQAVRGGNSLCQSALGELLRGNLNTQVPEAWQFFLHAARNELSLAQEQLEKIDDAQYRLYNRFVLNPSGDSLCEAQQRLNDPLLCEMLSVTAYAYGLSNECPAAETVTGELRAWAIATQSTQKIESEDFVVARQMLAEAIELARPTSPLLSAILLAQSAQVAQHSQLPAGLIQNEIEQAIAIAQTCQLDGFLGDLYTQLGMLLQRVAGENRHAMQAAVRAYQMALQSGISAQSNPSAFAEVQNNLGLAYLSMPQTESSNQLRSGIAIQSFRYALDSIDKQSHAEQWARVSMNLANALQYAPSSHPVENLVQAVEIYEQVLEVPLASA